MTQALFTLGRTLATPGALKALTTLGVNPASILDRHISGDFGTLDEHDLAMNMDALTSEGEGRIFSVYVFGDVRIWCITEWDRSATTILLPEEY